VIGDVPKTMVPARAPRESERRTHPKVVDRQGPERRAASVADGPDFFPYELLDRVLERFVEDGADATRSWRKGPPEVVDRVISLIVQGASTRDARLRRASSSPRRRSASGDACRSHKSREERRLYRRDLAVSRRLETRPPIEILKWAHGTFGSRVAILSSMQRAGSVLCHMADRQGLAFDVVFVDTGVLHKETLETRDELAKSHKNLRLVTLSPERTFARQTRDEGLLYLTREGQERCCDLRKSAPLRAIRGRYDAFVTALRRGEGERARTSTSSSSITKWPPSVCTRS
jgi:hypothetical protein